MSIQAQGERSHIMSGSLTFVMAAAVGIAVANIYYNQPMLNVMADDLPQAAPLIAPVTQLGYAAGLFALVPLGDILDRRRLIVGQFVILAVALAAMAFAQGSVMVLIASAAVGMTATVAQQIIPFAAHLAVTARRGTTLGMMMSGLLGGVLLSRTLAGFVATDFGWRTMYLVAAPVALVTAVVMRASLPEVAPATSLRYREMVATMGSLWTAFPQLRRATYTQSLIFAGFAAFWTILPFRLAEPAFGFGAEVAGLFGIVGAVGVFAAPIAGRLADSRGPHLVIRIGAIVALLSWIVFALVPTMGALVVGVVLLDFGMQIALVSNQSIVYSLRPEARSRLNTIFMGSMFLGSAVGSAAASAAWHLGGWTLVSVLMALAAAAAVLLQFRPSKADH